MKRSEINRLIKENESFLKGFKVSLPPFCQWTPEQWQTKGLECNEIKYNMLGWDVTDFGSGDFLKTGLFLITLRNGNQNNPKYFKPYAEKILILEEGQTCPNHFHWFKQEDIINRGGGIMCMKVYKSNENDGIDFRSNVEIVCDGVLHVVPAGTILELKPGESCTLTQRLYHSFWAKEGFGKCYIGEVSQCNDDTSDNCFLPKVGRFTQIEEDEKPYRLLCNEYPV